MPNGTYGGVRGRKTEVGRKLSCSSYSIGHLGFPGFPPGTVVAAGGPSVPIGRSGWKQIASTWNSDIGNGRFCGHPPFPVEGRGQSRLIIAFPAFHRARSSPLEDCRCRLAVPGGSK